MYAPVLEEDLPGLMEIAERSRATLTRWDHEFRIRVDGVVRWIHGDAVPYRTADGTTIWNGLLTDVTERKRAEDALRRATAEAEAANAAKDLFLAQMSHELRTPMNGVLGMVDLLGRTELDQEQRAYAQTITDSARGLLHIIDEILDFSRISAGQIALEHQPFQLSRAVQSVIAMFQAEARDRGLALLSSVDPGLPGHLAGDARRLRQILVNLIGNAFKFTERGHVRVDVSGAARDGEVALVCAVQDTGIGIPADQVANVFEPFRQADHSIRRRFGGTGLGLAISQRLAAAMGGSIEVSSQEGAGSVFRVRLPLAIATADEIEALAAPAPPAPTRNDDPLTVLIADDNAINRAVLCGMLDKMGHRVEAVDNGRQAVDAARSCDFDLVLMDIQMPVLDGLSAMREIRAMGGSRRHLPIIAVTAEAAAERLASYLRDGMDAYLVKPIELDALVSLLANIRQDAKRHATN
jgi:two-component system sensor histidine kinase EvgS